MNIVIVSVSLSIAVVILVPPGFVFGKLWGVLLAVFVLLLILVGLYVAEEKSMKAAILRRAGRSRKAERG
jgi:Gpi18-like mannosyltransferase